MTFNIIKKGHPAYPAISVSLCTNGCIALRAGMASIHIPPAQFKAVLKAGVQLMEQVEDAMIPAEHSQNHLKH